MDRRIYEFINPVGPSRIESEKIITTEHVNKSPYGNCGPDLFMNCDSYVFEVRLKRHAIASEKGRDIGTSHRRM